MRTRHARQRCRQIQQQLKLQPPVNKRWIKFPASALIIDDAQSTARHHIHAVNSPLQIDECAVAQFEHDRRQSVLPKNKLHLRGPEAAVRILRNNVARGAFRRSSDSPGNGFAAPALPHRRFPPRVDQRRNRFIHQFVADLNGDFRKFRQRRHSMGKSFRRLMIERAQLSRIYAGPLFPFRHKAVADKVLIRTLCKGFQPGNAADGAAIQRSRQRVLQPFVRRSAQSARYIEQLPRALFLSRQHSRCRRILPSQFAPSVRRFGQLHGQRFKRRRFGTEHLRPFLLCKSTVNRHIRKQSADRLHSFPFAQRPSRIVRHGV